MTPGAFTMLPPHPSKCQLCAVAHESWNAHDQESLYYRMRFHAVHGRGPTWADAIAHCPAEVQTQWKALLAERSAWSEPPPGVAAIAEPPGKGEREPVQVGTVQAVSMEPGASAATNGEAVIEAWTQGSPNAHSVHGSLAAWIDVALAAEREKTEHLLAAAKRLVVLVATIREEQISDQMGFGRDEQNKKRHSQVYAAAIARAAGEIDDALETLGMIDQLDPDNAIKALRPRPSRKAMLAQLRGWLALYPKFPAIGHPAYANPLVATAIRETQALLAQEKS